MGDSGHPRVPDGVEIVRVSARPDLWRAVYPTVPAQAFQDMALISPLDVSLEQWERDWISDPAAVFVALADGEVIGCAGLLPDTDDPGRPEHALTAVRRDWRLAGTRPSTLTTGGASRCQTAARGTRLMPRSALVSRAVACCAARQVC
jgi:mycothiol synthase